MDTKTCPRCGWLLMSDARECEKCHYVFEVKKKFCLKCGAALYQPTNGKVVRFCMVCGAPVEEDDK